MEASNFNLSHYATRQWSSVTPISDYPRLLIYSYLNLQEIVFQIGLLSKRERKLIENSAIVRESHQCEFRFGNNGKGIKNPPLSSTCYFERITINVSDDGQTTKQTNSIQKFLTFFQNLPQRFHDKRVSLTMTQFPPDEFIKFIQLSVDYIWTDIHIYSCND